MPPRPHKPSGSCGPKELIDKIKMPPFAGRHFSVFGNAPEYAYLYFFFMCGFWSAQLFIKLRWSICANRAHCSFCIGDLYCIFSPFDQLMPLPVAALLPICERLFGEVDQWHVIVDHHSAIFKFRKRIFYRFAQRALFRYPRFCQNGDMYRSTATWGS